MNSAGRPKQPLAAMSVDTLVPCGAPNNRHRRIYLALLTWGFALFSSVRILAYVPTMWAIHQSGDSSQHSLWTWVTWFGSNLTMALWLYEQGGQRIGRAAAVSFGNATMCAGVVALIAYVRW